MSVPFIDAVFDVRHDFVDVFSVGVAASHIRVRLLRLHRRMPPRIGRGETFFLLVLEAVEENSFFERDFFILDRLAMISFLVWVVLECWSIGLPLVSVQ